ncbi:hypothetical protein FXV83_16185 [Bradyrhizobium hipponense]|uniref:Uncharacterized protein n=1 Tax=Bradyrhizobium hipponense TaxID=2605638 RepID=A0A5S4YN95_9BRAD|nr:hypothetical protein [Bradyrhizobium hipponense]TYO65473.1 hypothetical protein FXV83_16185 [Bradyrhizobium hipponense]
MALKKTHAQFRQAAALYDETHLAPSMTPNPFAKERALFLAWWFIENVGPDDPARNEIFFELRGIVREAQGAG